MAKETIDSLQGSKNSKWRDGESPRMPPPPTVNAKSQARRRANERRRLERERSAVEHDELDRIVQVYGQPKPGIPLLPGAQPSTALEDLQRHVREDLATILAGSRVILSGALDLGRTPLRLWSAFQLWRARRPLQDIDIPCQGEGKD
ncbi:MAG: hypothetical protein LBM75_05520 [Myxococcales bacterium]|jgi:hypothetical protein|nr:hypothetical protein [Myxococcales bacterium]